MIKNSDLFYSRAAEYQTKRKDIVDDYEKKLARLESYKGSKGYDDDVAKATKEKDAAIEALKSEYSGYFDIAINAMREANSGRGVTPPSADQLAILQALKLRDSVSQKELDRAANSCKDNAMSIAVINEIAKKNGYIRGYHSESGELAVEAVDRTIDGLKSSLRDFMDYDTPRAARVARDHHAALYGADPNAQPLPKRKLFETKAEFYGMSGDDLTAFCNAVDGE